jgi:hypothetical protein
MHMNLISLDGIDFDFFFFQKILAFLEFFQERLEVGRGRSSRGICGPALSSKVEISILNLFQGR